MLYGQRWACQSVQVYVKRRLNAERTEWHREGMGGVNSMTLFGTSILGGVVSLTMARLQRILATYPAMQPVRSFSIARRG
jgi:hypothetical protein